MQNKNVVVKKNTLGYLALGGRGCPAGQVRGYQTGFTLIELLVVVLIIGILAAIAVPQYQMAVTKARAAEIITQLKALAVAEQVYFLANGEYTSDANALDLSFEISEPCTSSICQENIGLSFNRLTNDPPYLYGYLRGKWGVGNDSRFFINYVLPSGEMYCEVHNTAIEAVKRVCKSLGEEAPCPKNNGTPATCYKLP